MSENIPALTTEQMVEVDRVMVDDYHILLFQMMENAGRNLARLARTRFLDGNASGKNVIILAGTGGNGGGALVCARHLHNWGAQVTIALTKPGSEFKGVPAQQLDMLQRMKVPVDISNPLTDHHPFDLVVDGIIGYNLSGTPRGAAADLIRWANAQEAPILSLDTPSGLDTTSGQAHEPAVRATATLTLALPKTGLLQPKALEYVGELYLADISVPAELYQKSFGINVPPLFAENDILRVETRSGQPFGKDL
jgi:NAD(P)H-hydrate epimerase